LELLLFTIFKWLAICSAIFVVNVGNPVHAVLLLILVFINITSILILLEVEFLAFVFLIVYVGAIAVLFLFVVMMLNTKLVEITESTFSYLPINISVITFFSLQIAYTLFSIFPSGTLLFTNTYVKFIEYLDSYSNIQIIGQVLYLFYFFPFILGGINLLIAMIGVIIICAGVEKRKILRRQNIFSQTIRQI